MLSALWSIVVADSGSLKTPAFRLASDHLFTMQRRLDQEYKRELAEFMEAMEKMESCCKGVQGWRG